jgi:hypothetical protein
MAWSFLATKKITPEQHYRLRQNFRADQRQSLLQGDAGPFQIAEVSKEPEQKSNIVRRPAHRPQLLSMGRGSSSAQRTERHQEPRGQEMGVLVDTTTEADLKRTLETTRVNAEVVSAKTHAEGIEAVKNGSIAAYYGDRGILTFLLSDGCPRPGLLLADAYLSIEPYALALPRGDEDFCLAVDRALSQIYRSGEVVKLFATSFGASETFSGPTGAVYDVSPAAIATRWSVSFGRGSCSHHTRAPSI